MLIKPDALLTLLCWTWMRLDCTALCDTSALLKNALKIILLAVNDPCVLFIQKQSTELIWRPLAFSMRIDKLCVTEANTNLKTIR